MNATTRAMIPGMLLALLVPAIAVAQTPGTLFVRQDNVGIGTDTPSTALEITGQLASTKMKVLNNKSNVAQRQLVELVNNGGPGFQLTDMSNSISWKFAQLPGGNFEVTKVGSGGFLFRFDQSGDLVLRLGRLIEQSSRESKTSFESVDGREVLSQVVELPIQTWVYKDSTSGSRHIGPMAEEFHASFGLGMNSKTIATSDASGVALAAIQGLNAELLERDRRITELEGELAELRAMVESLAK